MGIALTDVAKRLLDGQVYVTLTTVTRDGSPHSTTMWALREGDDVVFSTVMGRAKEVHLRTDDRVGVAFFDPADPSVSVSIRGRASLTRDGAEELIQRLSQKYTGGRYTGDEGSDNVRVVVRVTPTRVIG